MDNKIFIKKTGFSKEFIDFLIEFVEIINYRVKKDSKIILFSVEAKKALELKDYLKIKDYFKKTDFKNISWFWKNNFKNIYDTKQIFEYLKFFFEKRNIKNIFRIIFNIDKLNIISNSFFVFEKYKKELEIFFEGIGIFLKDIEFNIDSNDKQELENYKIETIKKYEKFENFSIKKNTSIESKKNNDKKVDLIKGKIIEINVSIFSNKKTTKILIDTIDSAILTFLHPSVYEHKNIDELKENNWFEFSIKKNIYKNKTYLKIYKFEKINPIFERNDDSKQKRIEFHVHTKMSALDAVGSVEDYIKTAIHFGHKAIAFTDHENIHIFSELSKYIDKYKEIKLIFGCEFNFLSNESPILSKPSIKKLTSEKFVFFDLETTGLSTYYEEIIEFAAIVVKNGIIEKKESFLIKTDRKISKSIIELTGIDLNNYKKKALSKEIAIKKIKDIFKDNILVAHNAKFDVSFINKLYKEFNYENLKNSVFDTLTFSYYLNNGIKSHRLEKLAKFYNVEYNSKKAHRALYDVEVLNLVFFKMFNENNLEFKDIYLLKNHINIRKNLFSNHINILIKNQEGIKNLYKLISYSHTQILYKKPTLEKDILEKNKKGLLIGAGCFNSEVFEAALTKTQEELELIINYYDFIEVQPLEVYSHLIYREKITEEDLKELIIRIIKTSEKLNKIIIASSDSHYIEPKHKFYRDIFISTKQLKGSFHHLYDFRKRIKKTPNQHFRTTKEMLKNFDFLNDKKLINKIVIENPNKLNDLIQDKLVFDEGLNLPEFDNSDEILKKLAFNKLKKKYGNKPNKKLFERFNSELKKIIEQKFSSIYLLAFELTNYSLNENYLVGSRGSVGSSFLAYCLNITEVNPLNSHYHCQKCFYFEWVDVNLSGFDLKDKKCPKCENALKPNGQKILFESFLGLDGKSVPDIDLNFSGEFQDKAIKFVINLINKQIGKNKVFRAGTISTVAFRTAYAYLIEYLEKNNIQNKYSYSEKLKILNNCIGVKKTTGQHPGGLIIIPSDNDIFDFTPYNFPSNDSSKPLTTHFDYHVLKNKLLKLDVLGHDDPTALKMLFELTGVNPKTILFNDSKVIDLFSNIEILGIKPIDVFGETTGTIALPEFGTPFVRKILKQKKVSSFSDLISVSGLSHGTNVWESNAQDLLNENSNWTFHDVIACRDDVMQILLDLGLSMKEAYKFMRIIKKGKGLSNLEEKRLKELNVPEWFINSCQKISYMFPKAHATAYSIMAYRFAWFKINYPVEFYATYFSIRIDVFDLETILKGEDEVEKKYNKLNQNKFKKDKKLTTKEKKLLLIFETTKEMMARGIKIESLDLLRSHTTKFLLKIENGIKKIIPPLTSVDGLGIEIAKVIIKERKVKFFKSSIDFKNRTKINRSVYKILEKMGVLEQLDKFKQNTFNF